MSTTDRNLKNKTENNYQKYTFSVILDPNIKQLIYIIVAQRIVAWAAVQAVHSSIPAVGTYFRTMKCQGHVLSLNSPSIWSLKIGVKL